MEINNIMSLDEHLEIIRERYNTLAVRLHKSEKLKDIASIDKTGDIIRQFAGILILSFTRKDFFRESLSKLSSGLFGIKMHFAD